MATVVTHTAADFARANRSWLERLEPTAYVNLILKRSRREISTLYRRELRRQIDATTRRRTGTLRRSPRVKSRLRTRTLIHFNANFPRTAYSTPRGRGRPRASKVGQYAFVVNHHRRIRFLPKAIQAVVASAELRAILQKHGRLVASEFIGLNP